MSERRRMLLFAALVLAVLALIFAAAVSVAEFGWVRLLTSAAEFAAGAVCASAGGRLWRDR